MWHLEQVDEVTVVKLAIDQLNEVQVGEFQSRLAALTRTSIQIVFDLTRVESVDSSGLGALVLAHRRLEELGGELKLCAPSPAVEAVFDLVCLGKALDITDTREAALEHFGVTPRWPDSPPRPVQPTRRYTAPSG